MLWVYAISNTVFLIFNMVDIAYFPYIKKRSTADILMQAGGQTDLSKLLPQYIADFWYILLIAIVLVYLMIVLYRKVELPNPNYQFNLKYSYTVIPAMLISMSTVIIGIRGGLQRIPIDVVDAGKYTQPQYISLLVNSPFTIIKSLEKDELTRLDFKLPSPIKNIFDPVTHYPDTAKLRKLNVVILMVESFSKEYTKLAKGTSYTPFLDSLMDQSMVFTNAYSNGHKSIEGIPAILSSLPSLMENPVINSAYSGNQYTSLASILRKEGYSTAFFHGGINGTMNFDSYAMQAGYQTYYGKNEYGNDAEFDGYWGIWDEEFYNFSIKKINELPEPFHSAIFSLSSHHPYLIPAKYRSKFPKGTLENHESIGYGDYALRKFFDTAKKQPWYQNTLFVITADHCSISSHPFYSNNLGQFSIPILFYLPDNSLRSPYNGVFQQSDIVPSILSYLNYNKPVFCFGKSYAKATDRYVNYYTNSTHYMLNDSLLFTFNGYELKELYKYKTDSLLKDNLAGKLNAERSVNYFKAFIQTYNNSLIDNTCEAK